jgi:amino acid transporter
MAKESESFKKEEGLKHSVLSPWLAMANGLASNAPSAVTALYFVGLAAIVGGSLPLTETLAWLIYSSMTYVVYEWSKHVAASYGWAAIQKKGFNNSFISFVMGGLGYWYYYTAAAAGFGILGLSTFLPLLFPTLYSTYPWIWIPISIAIALETTLLMYLGIKTNSRYNLYTGLAEVSFILITSIILVFKAGAKNTFLPFTPLPLGNSWPLILTSMIFGITTFGGMNSSIPVAEETTDPKKNIPKALITLALLLGIPIILNSYAQEITFGISKMFNYASFPDPGIIIYAASISPIAAAIFAGFIINSFNSSTIDFGNSQVRMAYGMARDRVLFPLLFTEINKYGVPGKAISSMGLLNLGIALAVGLAFCPLNGSTFLITSNAYFNFLNHMLASFGLIRFKHKNGTLKLKDIIIGGIVIVTLAAAIVLSAISPSPLDYAGALALGWFVFSTILYLIEKKRHPENLKRFGDYSL